MLPNPGKGFYLHLAVKVVCVVNGQRVRGGVTYAKPAVIISKDRSISMAKRLELAQRTLEQRQSRNAINNGEIDFIQ